MKSIKELDLKKIEYTLVKHSGSSHTAKEAAEEINLELGQIVKSLVIEGPICKTILVLIPGDRKIDFKKLKSQIGDKRVELAKPGVVFRETGYPVGLVTPFDLKKPLPIYADEAILRYDKVGLSSGKKGFELVLDPNDLIKATRAMVGEFTK